MYILHIYNTSTAAQGSNGSWQSGTQENKTLILQAEAALQVRRLDFRSSLSLKTFELGGVKSVVEYVIKRVVGYNVLDLLGSVTGQLKLAQEAGTRGTLLPGSRPSGFPFHRIVRTHDTLVQLSCPSHAVYSSASFRRALAATNLWPYATSIWPFDPLSF